MSVSDFLARNQARGIILTGDNGSPEQCLLGAWDYMNSQDFIGYKKTKEQSGQWPRTDAWVDGFLLDDDEIPTQLVGAQIETAIAIDAGNSPLSNLERETKREKVGDVEVEYADGAKEEAVIRSIDIHLRKLLNSSSGSGNGYVNLMRA